MKEDFYWLNEDSRTFLQRGTLLEGETGEREGGRLVVVVVVVCTRGL